MLRGDAVLCARGRTKSEGVASGWNQARAYSGTRARISASVRFWSARVLPCSSPWLLPFSPAASDPLLLRPLPASATSDWTHPSSYDATMLLEKLLALLTSVLGAVKESLRTEGSQLMLHSKGEVSELTETAVRTAD